MISKLLLLLPPEETHSHHILWWAQEKNCRISDGYDVKVQTLVIFVLIKFASEKQAIEISVFLPKNKIFYQSWEQAHLNHLVCACRVGVNLQVREGS